MIYIKFTKCKDWENKIKRLNQILQQNLNSKEMKRNAVLFINGYIIIWILHQISMYFNKVKLVAG